MIAVMRLVATARGTRPFEGLEIDGMPPTTVK